ncbi:tRNA-dihydrouridine synthase A [Sesbania bispinosa]|nr:tRNA-dihydrouridine synthase A [Sesbania bispinosa]
MTEHTDRACNGWLRFTRWKTVLIQRLGDADSRSHRSRLGAAKASLCAGLAGRQQAESDGAGSMEAIRCRSNGWEARRVGAKVAAPDALTGQPNEESPRVSAEEHDEAVECQVHISSP